MHRLAFVTILALVSSVALSQSAPALTPLAHIEQRGHGPVAMILIPGLSCDWRVFERFMTDNADRYTMLAVTLPGFGQSAAPPRPADAPATDPIWLNNAENAFLELIRDRQLDKPVIVGHFIQYDRPAELNAAIADFLSGSPVKGVDAPPASMPASSKSAQ